MVADLDAQIAALMAERQRLKAHRQQQPMEPQSVIASEEEIQAAKLAAIEAATHNGEEKPALPEVVPGFKLSALSIRESPPRTLWHIPPSPPHPSIILGYRIHQSGDRPAMSRAIAGHYIGDRPTAMAWLRAD
jgi:hypothetical protein